MTQTLPKGILVSDLKYPDYSKRDKRPKDIPYEDTYFELYFVPGFNWCIPTLLIRNPGRRSSQTTARTYAVTVDTQKLVRIGLGPHVTEKHTVYLRQSRIKDLMPYIELRRKGAAQANQVRDRISTRRMRRDIFGGIFS
jgi:hypothetical protein